MPKPRGQNTNPHKWYPNEHLSKRVSFKQRDNYKRVIRNFESYEDSGIDLTGHTTSRGSHMAHHRKFNRGGRNRAGSPAPSRRLFTSALSWYRVHMPYGGKYDKPFLLKKLLENLNPLPFMPYMWSGEGRSATFYVEDFHVAEKLNNLSKEIEMPDGFKLIISVRADTPNVDVNETLREKMKLVMAKRYNPVTKALDLTKFHADPDLQDTFCPLFKPAVSLAAMNIIGENIPELEALNLNNNNIQVINHLKELPKKMPALKILHISGNKLKSINHLDSFTGLPIIELMLDGNGLCDNYNDQASYISEVRKRFPKLLSLDAVDLPPPIFFDVEEVTMPTTKQTFLCSEDGQAIVRQFLAQYFEIMDGDNRQALLHAYHETAMFSCTMAYAYNQHPKNSAQLSWYNTDNRNLERVTDVERRRKLLKQGHLAVVAFHAEMPQTTHDLNSFTVDLTLFTPQMICLHVSGLFRERRQGKKNSVVRHFFRTFVIVPAGAGFCIINEMLHITNATEEQMEQAFKTPVVAAAVPPPVAMPMGLPMVDDDTKQLMLQALMQETSMNLEWSQKCLQESTWDYQRAQFAYNEAKNHGAIPPEAYVK